MAELPIGTSNILKTPSQSSSLLELNSHYYLRSMDAHIASSNNYFSQIRDQELFGFFNGSSNISTYHPQHSSPPHHQAPATLVIGNNNVCSFVTSSPPHAIAKGHSGKKRKRKDGKKELERPNEVIHVRAKRGQATDSHSLAERVRREKINEKLRCLQELVPGCYKTMGMAVMLDVVINYLQSLQNQIEFLSLKLTAASMHYDFNLEDTNIEKVQGTNAYEVQEMERMSREGHGLWRSF